MTSRTLAAVLSLAVAAAANAQTAATGTIQLVSTSGSTYNYDIKLTNSGTTGIQTFWFAWVPGLNFMPDMPTNIGSPSTWTESVTGGAAGYAIQWKTSGGLAAGSALDGFTFSSTDSLAVLEGNSQGSPILTSYVYSGQPFSGTFKQFVVTPVAAPEPASLLALVCAAAPIVLIRRRPTA